MCCMPCIPGMPGIPGIVCDRPQTVKAANNRVGRYTNTLLELGFGCKFRGVDQIRKTAWVPGLTEVSTASNSDGRGSATESSNATSGIEMTIAGATSVRDSPGSMGAAQTCVGGSCLTGAW